MRYRHALLVFGAIILAALAAAWLRGQAAVSSLYPKGTEGLAEFHRLTGGVASGGDVYYNDTWGDADDWLVGPIAVEPLPFGFCRDEIGYDDPRYFHVRDTDDWIYSCWKSTRSGVSMDILHCADIEMPTPERATQLYLSWGFPNPGEEIDALFLTDDTALVNAAIQALEGEYVLPDSLSRLRDIGYLQFRSEEYPGVGINCDLRRDRKGMCYILRQIIVPTEMLGSTYRMPEDRLYPLPEELNQLIQQALSSKNDRR